MPFRVESQNFAPKRKDIGKMQVRFYPKGVKGNDEKNVTIVIRNENQSRLLVHWKLFLVDCKSGNCHQVESTDQFHSFDSKLHSLSRRTLLSLLSSLPKDELIIDCNVTIFAQENIENPFMPSCSFTDLALFTYHYVPFTWTIEGYLKQVSTRECAISPLFSPPTDSKFTAFLRVYPKKDKKNVFIELNFVSNCQINEYKVDWRRAVVNAKGEEWKPLEWSGVLEKSKGSGLRWLISHKELDDYRSILLPDDKLTIKFQLWFHEPRKNLPPEMSTLPSNDPSADLAQGVTKIIFGDNANLTNAILPIHSTLTARNITTSLVSKSAESEPKPK